MSGQGYRRQLTLKFWNCIAIARDLFDPRGQTDWSFESLIG
jgi:hypothetical protein